MGVASDPKNIIQRKIQSDQAVNLHNLFMTAPLCVIPVWPGKFRISYINFEGTGKGNQRTGILDPVQPLNMDAIVIETIKSSFSYSAGHSNTVRIIYDDLSPAKVSISANATGSSEVDHNVFWKWSI